jgi:hypothetical protein
MVIQAVPKHECMSTRSTSIPVILAKLLMIKLVALDVSHYLMQYFRPSIDSPAGDTIFGPSSSMVPRCAWVAFFTVCGMCSARHAIMGISGLTRIHTHQKPVPALVGIGTYVFGYGFSRVSTGMKTRMPVGLCHGFTY